MKKLLGFLQKSHFALAFSLLLAFLMVITLLPHEIIATNLQQHSVQVLGLIDSKTDLKDVTSESDDSEPPQVVTRSSPLEIHDTYAIIQGVLISTGTDENVKVSIEYGTDNGLGFTSESIEMNSPGGFEVTIYELSPSNTYCYRAVAFSSAGNAYGEVYSFITIYEPEIGLSADPTTDINPQPDPVENQGGEIGDNATGLPDPLTKIAVTKPPKIQQEVTPDQDQVINSPDSKINLKIPKGAVSANTLVEMTEIIPENSYGLKVIKLVELNAFDSTTKAKISKFDKELELTIHNEEEELAGINRDTIRLAYLDEDKHEWVNL